MHANVPGRVPPPPAVGIVLAGGRATRMGAAADPRGGKGAMRLAGRTLLDHVLDAIGPEVDEVIVVAAAGQAVPTAAAVRVVHDSEPGGGPLAGLRDGLRAVVGHRPEAMLARSEEHTSETPVTL